MVHVATRIRPIIYSVWCCKLWSGTPCDFISVAENLHHVCHPYTVHVYACNFAISETIPLDIGSERDAWTHMYKEIFNLYPTTNVDEAKV